MGKRKIEKIEAIENLASRKVTFCKRKKGLLKKAIELSVLCDLSIFCLIYDKSQGRIVHYSSDPTENVMMYFNQKCHREFYCNKDYVEVGGRKEDFPIAYQNQDDKDEDNGGGSDKFRLEEPAGCDSHDGQVGQKRLHRAFSKKRIEYLSTSRIGDLNY